MNRVRKAMSGTIFALMAVAVTLPSALAVDGARAAPQSASPFSNLAGWWGGKGRLKFTDGKMEEVRCRATYFVEGEGQDLRQNIRCASQSGKIELKAQVRHSDGTLSGEWAEEMYNVSGTLDGGVTPHGFRVEVKSTNGSSLAANMDIIVKERRQLVEIQFFSETLVGLTLLLEKG